MRLTALLALGVALAGSNPAVAQGSAQKSDTAVVAVVELFTSQGCSSCPEADALLGKLAARPDVLALSFSVDYWDYLGWKDTLADAKFSERQKSYKGPLGVHMVYTPMMVLNGLTHLNGSDESRVLNAIEKSMRIAAATNISVRMGDADGRLVIDVGAAPQATPPKDATLWLAKMAKTVTVPIARGENRGRSITYNNVVRELTPLGTWSGRPMTVKLERQAVAATGVERCAVLLQQGKGGPIIGATTPGDC